MIIRVEKDRDNPYAMIHNGILNDVRLSWRARGIAAYLLSKPDDWRINHKLIASAGPDGVRAVLRAMKELETAGYLHRERIQRDDGRWESLVTLTEVQSPNPRNAHSVAREKPSARKPTLGEPNFGEPTLGKRAPIQSTEHQILTPSTEGQNTQQQGVVGGGPFGGEQPGAVLGVSSNMEGGGLATHGEDDAAPATDDVPDDIAELWSDAFGELTDKQTKFLANAIKGDGADMLRHALGIAAGNIAAGIEVNAPAAYVKSIITRCYIADDYGPDAVTHRRPGETDSPKQRKAYQL